MAVTEQMRKKLAELPHKPGVYLMKDRFGKVIYVGKARDLRRRVSQYFHPSRRMGWDLKFRALVEAIQDLDVHTVASEAEALLLEGKLIKEFQPRYNISFRDDKRFLMVKVQLQDRIPRFTLTRIRLDDGARYFGPFPNAGALRSAMTFVRRQFHLRGCRAFHPTEEDYKHCLYANLKHCTAPCVSNVTPEQYRQQVEAACDFLDGQCEELVGQLEAEMKKAAATLDFEKAAQLRDAVTDLKRSTQKPNTFVRLPYSLPVAIDPARDLDDLAKVLGLAAAPAWIEGFDVSTISGTFSVASLVSFRNGKPDRNGYRRFKIKTVQGQDDFACMAEAVHRRYSRLLREAKEAPGSGDSQESRPGTTGKRPDLILIDGGKGQLSAACAELEKLGLAATPVIGLAKEFEEIHRPGSTEPLRLPHDSGALKLLQRVRDESHRLANSFNAQLRLKKISESLLDEFPGMGEKRKAALLKKFGSVERLRRAAEADIRAVPGFGGKIAAELKTFLETRSVPPPMRPPPSGS